MSVFIRIFALLLFLHGIRKKWWKRLTIARVKIFLERHSADLVQLCGYKGYIFLLTLLVYHYPGYHDDWDPSPKMYKPHLPIPREQIYNMSQLQDGITFVTAYYDLGRFKKGVNNGLYFDRQTYENWMVAYSKLNHSVIFLTDSPKVEAIFRDLRKTFPGHMTRIINVKQESLWSFRLAPKIKKIYAQLGYPYWPPNTVDEKYSCAMHAKYEGLEIVIRRKLYKTKHLAWVDIGYFRDKETKPFKLELPPGFKKDHIAFTQIDRIFEGFSAQDIIGNNLLWIAGGMFIGQPDYLIPFIADYKRTVESLIADNLMNTDQQVLYIMYSKNYKVRARVPVQVYYHNCRCDWFFLGNICRYEWEKKTWHRPLTSYFWARAL